MPEEIFSELKYFYIMTLKLSLQSGINIFHIPDKKEPVYSGTLNEWYLRQMQPV